MKALILAAGSKEHQLAQQTTDTWVLQPLGDHAIIDYVVTLAEAVVGPEDIYIVTSALNDDIMTHLSRQPGRDLFRYVVQSEVRGTGDAVLQARGNLADYDGPLLILYGDTPLLRESSVRGLVTRHRLKQAAFTLLSAAGSHDLSYGRIQRDEQNRIVDIIETSDETEDETAIVREANRVRAAGLKIDAMDPAAGQGDNLGRHRDLAELNIGAYVADASALWPVLQQTARMDESAHRLTDVVSHLAADGQRIESYQALDLDELQGINTAKELESAAFILQKRQLRPRRSEEHNVIRFGTGGWRARIGEGFTLDNVRRLCQALANQVTRSGREADGVLIGYDRRFLGDVAAHAAAEVFAGNNIPVQLLNEDVPTPLVTYATAEKQFAYGLMFTASHNPAHWNGLKVFATDGSLPLDDETILITDEANALRPNEVVKVELETALSSGMAQEVDYTNAYVDAVEALIDMQAIRDAGLRVVVDPMYGVGQVTLEIVLIEARCRVTTIHSRHDPLFGGRSPAPDSNKLDLLIQSVQETGYDLGLAMDGDADRIAIVDGKGNFITTNELLLLLYYYLHEVRGEVGGVTRNLATTHLLDRLAAHVGETCYEVPVGFKHLAASMKEYDVLLAGESSGGLSIRGHILGKDGIFACALVVEMMARTGRSISDMLDEIYAITGRLVSREVNLPATSEMKVMVPRMLEAADLSEIAGYPVERISHKDGAKFYLENDNWLLLRFSGTEPLLRIFAEADDEEKVDALIGWAERLVAMEE